MWRWMTGLSILAIVPSAVHGQPSATPSGDQVLIDRYCLSCHNAERHAAGLMLDQISANAVGQDAEVWERVVRTLRGGTMPPLGLPRPDPGVVDALASSLERQLDAVDVWTVGSDRTALVPAQLAPRLAQTLWSTEPDSRLTALARSGQLTEEAVLTQQLQRMLADPRAQAFIEGFFGDWLYLRNVASIMPEREHFPGFDAQLREAFRQETARFLASQLREDRSVLDLLTANYTFLNDRLAAHYGITGVEGQDFRRVTLPDNRRAGLLGQASVLAITSYANRTSPVLRGMYIMENLLGVTVPPIPPNVPALSETFTGPMRVRMEEHRRNPVCASCHSMMDVLGFGLENFDAIGRWREAEDGVTIDASGLLPDGSYFSGPAELRTALVAYRDAYVRTLTEHLFAYVVGRGTGYQDMPTIRAIVRNAAVSGYRWSALVRGVVQSQPFQAAGVPR